MNSWIIVAAFANAYIIMCLSLLHGPFDVFYRFREHFADRHDWFYKLITCPYCTAFYTSFFFALYFQTNPVEFILLWLGFAGASSTIAAL